MYLSILCVRLIKCNFSNRVRPLSNRNCCNMHRNVRRQFSLCMKEAGEASNLHRHGSAMCKRRDESRATFCVFKNAVARSFVMDVAAFFVSFSSGWRGDAEACTEGQKFFPFIST